MISRFATWIKPGGFLEFTTGQVYEKYLKENGFKILLREHDQEHHLVWIAQHKS